MRGFSGVIFLTALLPRLYVAIAWAREPVWDGHYYDIGARSIAAGLGYVGTSGAPWSHYPVGYSAFLGLLYRFVGSHQWVAPVAGAVTGALTATFIYLLARHATTEARARLAGMLVALHPGLITYAALVMTESLAGLGLVAAALLTVRRRGVTEGVIPGGIVLGLTTLVRPPSILCAPALGLLGRTSMRRTARSWLLGALIATAMTIVMVIPWSVRNCRVMDGCAFVSTNAGWNLAIGSTPRATGRFTTLRASDGCTVVTGQVQQDRCWLEQGGVWISQAPMRWLRLIPLKLSQTFDHESFPIGYLAEADNGRWPAARQAQARKLLSLWHAVILCLAPLAFVPRNPGRRGLLGLGLVTSLVAHAAFSPLHPLWPLALAIVVLAPFAYRDLKSTGGVLHYAAYAIGTVCLVHAVFFGEDRYHMVVSPLLCLLAASAWRAPNTKAAAH